MELPIGDIIEEKRIRQSLGDLSELMKSMRQHGLINPTQTDQLKVPRETLFLPSPQSGYRCRSYHR